MPGYIVPTKDSDTVTSIDYARYIRENFRQGIPHILTTKGDIAAASELRQAVRVNGNSGEFLVADSTASGGVKFSKAVGVYLNRLDTSAGGIDLEDGQRYLCDWYVSANSAAKYESHTFLADQDRITIPAGLGGLYHLYYSVDIVGNSSVLYYITLRISGSISYALAYPISSGQSVIAGLGYNCSMEKLVSLAAGDTMRFYFQSDGFAGVSQARPQSLGAQVALTLIR